MLLVVRQKGSTGSDLHTVGSFCLQADDVQVSIKYISYGSEKSGVSLSAGVVVLIASVNYKPLGNVTIHTTSNQKHYQEDTMRILSLSFLSNFLWHAGIMTSYKSL